MPDLLAIVSKAVFEATAKNAAPGQVLPLDSYVTTHKALEPLREGGRLFLVTVRPGEQLWLVGVLDTPKHDGKAWVGKNAQPVTDVSAARGKIRFTSDTGMSMKPGALGMSLQTPRQLTAADVALLLGGKVTAAPAAKAAPAKAEKPAAAKKSAPPPLPPRAPAAPSARHGDLAALLKAGKWSEAMAALLAQWQSARAPELAELIARVSSKLPAGQWKSSPPDPTKVDLVALLSTMTAGKFADSLARIAQLEKLPPDPRISAALTRLIVTPPFTAQSSRAFWASLYGQLNGKQVDLHTLTAVKPLASNYQATFGATKMGEAMESRLKSLVSTLQRHFAEPASADVTGLLALVPAAEVAAPSPKTKGGKTLDQLLARVYEQPDDETVRQVYADALLEVGDPRGDFMVLQLKRARGEALTAAEEKQEAALQKKHAKAWLGPLYDVLYTTHLEFRGGFLWGAQIRPVAKALPAARNHPAWNTVRELNMSTGGTNERGASLILQPNTRRIRVLTDVVFYVLDELIASPLPDRELEVLEVSWLPLSDGPVYEGEPIARRAWEGFLASKDFPKLKELRLGYEACDLNEVGDLWKSPMLRQLERVRLSASGYGRRAKLADAVAHCSKALTVELDYGPLLAVVKPGGVLELSPEKSRNPIAQIWKGFVAELDPAHWKKVTLRGLGPDADVKALEQRLPRAEVKQEAPSR